MSEVLAQLALPGLLIALAAGVLAGLYLAVFHPPVHGSELLRRASLQGWYFGFLGSIFYGGRLAFALARVIAADPGQPPGDVPRIATGWILWLAFAAALTVGAYIGGRVRGDPGEEG